MCCKFGGKKLIFLNVRCKFGGKKDLPYSHLIGFKMLKKKKIY